MSYDGYRSQGVLHNGLGRLVDGEFGLDNFHFDLGFDRGEFFAVLSGPWADGFLLQVPRGWDGGTTPSRPAFWSWCLSSISCATSPRCICSPATISPKVSRWVTVAGSRTNFSFYLQIIHRNKKPTPTSWWEPCLYLNFLNYSNEFAGEVFWILEVMNCDLIIRYNYTSLFPDELKCNAVLHKKNNFLHKKFLRQIRDLVFHSS